MQTYAQNYRLTRQHKRLTRLTRQRYASMFANVGLFMLGITFTTSIALTCGFALRLLFVFATN